jgi:hypothetical protein
MNLNNDKMFVRDQCIYKTVRKGDLNRHIKRIHIKMRDFECKSCNDQRSTKDL